MLCPTRGLEPDFLLSLLPGGPDRRHTSGYKHCWLQGVELEIMAGIIKEGTCLVPQWMQSEKVNCRHPICLLLSNKKQKQINDESQHLPVYASLAKRRLISIWATPPPLHLLSYLSWLPHSLLLQSLTPSAASYLLSCLYICQMADLSSLQRR